MRGIIEKRPVSPKDFHEYGGETMMIGTPRRGQGTNGSGEKVSIDQN